ncbi:MAG: RluA family pseudouridine synthase [Eubacteriales bacterium]|nr:RluA family pseudouridine synthase [Eubacteriales bacterium]
MFAIEIGENEKQQRLDRFLRKYLENAPLSRIYKIVRKDVKVNGKRMKAEYILEEGDVIQLYLPDEEIAELRRVRKTVRAKRTFRICYEDENILLAEKPAGLLTHGDRNEKRNHLANQVIDYLIGKEEFKPREEKTFTPASVNRLDRNTSGLVLFGKNYQALKDFNEMMRARDSIHKRYLAIVCGKIPERTVLKGYMRKNADRNRVSVDRLSSGESIGKTGNAAGGKTVIEKAAAEKAAEEKYMKTIASPLAYGELRGHPCTLASVEISTGRTHQIRAQLADAGWPIAGDPKYGDPKFNRLMEAFGVHRQMLHARELRMERMMDAYSYLNGRSFTARIPGDFQRAADEIFGGLPDEA